MQNQNNIPSRSENGAKSTATVSENPGKTLSEIKTRQESQNNILNTVKNWDELCYKAILSELAPKGFKESRDKRFRGTIISTLDMLTKNRVDKTCKIAASLVRGYRENLRRAILDELEVGKKAAEDINDLVKSTPFHKFRLLKNRTNDLKLIRAKIEGMEMALAQLDHVSIKS